MPEDVISTAEAARLLGCSVSTVTRLANSGELRPLRKLPGRRGSFLFIRSMVEAYRNMITEVPVGTGNPADTYTAQEFADLIDS